MGKHRPRQHTQACASSIKNNLGQRSVEWAFKHFSRFDLHSGRTLLVFWFVARLLVFLSWAVFSPSTQGDILYYYNNIDRLFDGTSPTEIMTEYPTPVLWLLAIPWLIGFGTSYGYVTAFVTIMLGLDAAFAYSLWRGSKRLGPHAVAVWIVFLALCGPTVYLRFDLVTSVLAGWAILSALKQRSAMAGAFAGVGAAVKLWPALLWPALFSGGLKSKIRTTIGFWLAGAGLALASLIWGGWDRLLSPLSWQSGRGLQVESVWATVPMLMRAFGLGDYAVLISRFQAFEVYGTGVAFWIKLSDFAFIAGLAIMIVAFALWIIRGRGYLMESVAFMFLVVILMIVTNKTFSPQYMIWLGGPLAAAFAIMGARNRDELSYHQDRQHLWIMTLLILVTAGLTVLVYPIGYSPLVRDSDLSHIFRLPITLILAIRNICIILAFIQVLQWIWQFIRPNYFRKIHSSSTVVADIPVRSILD